MSTHPEILWAQRSSDSDAEKNVIYLTVNLTEINESTLKLDLQPKEIHFEAQAGRPEVKDYKFDLKLFGEIDAENSTKKLSTRSLVLVLRKKELKLEYWPRLTEEKRVPYVKTDFSKWVDEDEQDGAAAGLDDDFGGGMGGMDDMDFGGMGGGMGGVGGMGSGGMDFEKMMADIKANKDGTGPEGVDPADSDSDDDEGPPPLEEAEEPKKDENEAGPSGSSSSS